MIIELIASLVINTNIKETNVSNLDNLHTTWSNITPGDSVYQREQNQRLLDERALQSRIETQAREKTTRASRKSVNQTNPYAYGYCTWYVAREKGITQIWGDAKYWPVNSNLPTVGAIIVTYENKRYGHVGIIREVNGTQVKIEEMNYIGFNKVSTRVVDYRTLPLKGFFTS